MKSFLRAFTLIELLIVVAIIAILAAIAVPNFLEAQIRSKVARTQSDMRTVATALETFRVENNRYPTSWSCQNGTGPQFFGVYANLGDPLFTLEHICEGSPKATLTTPISYLSTALTDPFRVAEVEGDRMISWGYGSDLPQASNAWVLESVGPDMTGGSSDRPSAGGNDTGAFVQLYQFLGPEATKEYFLYGRAASNWPGSYDPSNGTISRGDIVRLSY
jgi:prepilin-type N-terminal cleavage/methylation domain-containing protein